MSAKAPVLDRLDPLAAVLLKGALALPWLVLALLVATLLFAPTTARAAPEAGRCGTDLYAALPAETRETVDAAAAEVPAGDARFWRIEKPGIAPSHLLGTFHTADPRVTHLAPSIAATFQAADRLAVEVTEIIDPQASAAVVFSDPGRITLPDGQRLGDLIDPTRLDTVKAMLAEKGMPLPLVDTLQPWFLAMSLAAPTCAAMAITDPADVLDGTLIVRKRAAGGEVIGLETMDEQLDVIASMPLDTQVEQLVALTDFGDRMNDVMETMVDLYLAGRIATIMPALEAALPNAAMLVGATEATAAFQTALIDERNQRMVARMIPLLERGNSFVAVGALHLPGENGIVERLRAEGWTVTKGETAPDGGGNGE